ncbi:TrbI/VirB10 family protein, partial [Roseospira visakhapatnamensis]
MTTSALCELALALGLTLGGHCVAPPVPVPASDLPPDDPGAYALPDPPPPAPAPAPAPVVMPPIIIEKVLPAPAPPAPAPVVVQPPPPPPPPDPMATALAALWAGARGAPGTLRPVVAGLPPAAPAMPATRDMAALDLATPATADYGGPRRTSSPPVDNTRIITADRYITGILETGINSQVGGDDTGTVVVQTARDVYGYHGRKVLMPKGSRLICDYQAPEDIGSSRLAITCQRVLIAGHRAEIRNLDSLLSDVQGRV